MHFILFISIKNYVWRLPCVKWVYTGAMTFMSCHIVAMDSKVQVRSGPFDRIITLDWVMPNARSHLTLHQWTQKVEGALLFGADTGSPSQRPFVVFTCEVLRLCVLGVRPGTQGEGCSHRQTERSEIKSIVCVLIYLHLKNKGVHSGNSLS